VAVAALLNSLGGAAALERVVLGTTRWVLNDPAADVAGLTADVSPDLPLLAVNLDFSASRHAPLRAYERCLVKEGVGAGGACLAALLSGASLDELHAAIDAAYDLLV
jgi:NaMN:DMB phosphoribosyltransferase